MTHLLLSLAALLALALFSLGALRVADERADRREAARLLETRGERPPRFDPAMVAGLPEPARRFFHFAIADGTPLYAAARIEMTGRFALGTKDAPNDLPMRATQILAAPHGFLWTMRGGSGAMRVSGSDSGLWTRFRLFDLVPVARVGSDADHRRSSFGRLVAEAVFWTPAAFLPGPGVSWTAVDADTARVTVRHGDLEQAVDLSVDARGAPVRVTMQRWSNANPERVWRLQPFGGLLSEHRRFDGFTLPTRAEAGNHIGTDAWYPFFIADVTQVRFAASVW